MPVITGRGIIRQTFLLTDVDEQLGMRVSAQNSVVHQSSGISVVLVGNRGAQPHIELALIDIQLLFYRTYLTYRYRLEVRGIRLCLFMSAAEMAGNQLLNLFRRSIADHI
ncbi:hypothetical protein D3C75_1144400 [compost metagenome]